MIENETEAAAVRELLARHRVDAVVFAPAMAAPPSFGQIALERCGAPVVLWNALTTRTIAVDIGQAEATENSTTVGCTMFANTLLRQGRPAPTVTAPLDDEPRLELLRRTVAGAAAAGSLRGASLLRIGAPIAGYRNIEASAEQLAELGLREVDVSADELGEAFDAVGPGSAATVLDELHAAGFLGDGGPEAARSARLAEAIRVLLDRHDAALGTVNCHGPLLRFSDRIGITACLAVAREALRARPLSCTGDGPAAIALLLARRLAGAALYNECYAAEPASGLLLVAAGGEGDPGWADGPVQLEANDHYPGNRGQGSSVAFALRTGSGNAALDIAGRRRLEPRLGDGRDRRDALGEDARPERDAADGLRRRDGRRLALDLVRRDAPQRARARAARCRGGGALRGAGRAQRARLDLGRPAPWGSRPPGDRATGRTPRRWRSSTSPCFPQASR